MAQLYLNRQSIFFCPRLNRGHRDDLLQVYLAEDVEFSCRAPGPYTLGAALKDGRTREGRIHVQVEDETLRVRFSSSDTTDLIIKTTVPEGDPESWQECLPFHLRAGEPVELEVSLFDRLVLSMVQSGRKRLFETPSMILRSADRYQRIDRGII